MDKKEIIEIIKECIDTKTTIEDIVMKKYEDKDLATIVDYLEKINETIISVKDQIGPVGLKQVYEYLSAPRDQIKIDMVKEDGTVQNMGTVEGNISFDPNGEIPTVSEPTFDDGLISYGDKTYEKSEPLDESKRPLFGDEQEKKDPYDLMDSTNGVEKSELYFGDKKVSTSVPGMGDDDYIPKPVYGDEDKEFNDILNDLNIPINPNGFEYGDKSVNGDDPSKKVSGSTVTPLNDIKYGDEGDNTPPTDDNGFNGPKFGKF